MRWAGDGPSYGSPIITTVGGTKRVITITQTEIIGVAFATGALLWERPFAHPNVGNSNTPLLYGQTIIVGGNIGPTIAFTTEKSGTEWTTKTVWENPDVPLRLTNLVLMSELLSASPIATAAGPFHSTRRQAKRYGLRLATRPAPERSRKPAITCSASKTTASWSS